LGHNFKQNPFWIKKSQHISSKFCLLSNPLVEHGFHWFWMFFPFLGWFGGCGLVGMSEKGKLFGFHWFLFFFATFWTSFVIVAAAHLRGARHLQYP
jgi:hypothetical protein